MLAEILTVAIYGGPPVATLGLGCYLHYKKKPPAAPPEDKPAELLDQTRQQQAKLASSPLQELEYDPLAFWLWPDWSGGHNLADPGTQPFWMLPPKPPEKSAGVENYRITGINNIVRDPRANTWKTHVVHLEPSFPPLDKELLFFACRALHYLRMRFAVGGIGISAFTLELDKPAKGQVFITFDTWRHNSGTCLLSMQTLQGQPEEDLDKWHCEVLVPSLRMACRHKKISKLV